MSISYGSTLTENQRLVDGLRIAAGAELINKNASKLSADEVKAIKEITSINVPAGKAQLGLTGSHEATFSDHYLSGVKSAAWMGSMFAHEGQHRLQVGVYVGANLWMDEQKASRVQLGVGAKLGMSRGEQRWLRYWSADSNKAALQAHMTGGYTD